MEENKLKQIGYQVSGADNHLKAREDRIAHTPKTDVVWSGEIGASRCYPQDIESKKLLAKFGTTYIAYDKSGEPNFSSVSVVSVEISNMTSDRQKNFSGAGKKILNTEWARETGIQNLTQLEEYRKVHHLTYHECSDGVTVQLVPTEIHARFRHSGGVAELSAMDAPLDPKADGLLRSAGKIGGKVTIRINQGKVVLSDSIVEFANTVSNNTPQIVKDFLSGGVDALTASAIPLVICGTQDLIKIACGEMTAKEAAEDLGEMGVSIAVGGGTTQAASYALGQALENSDVPVLKQFAEVNKIGNILVVGTILARAAGKYLSGEIDGRGFFEEISQSGLSLISGMLASEATKHLLEGVVAGGAAGLAVAAAPALAAMIVSSACSAIYAQAKKLAEEKRDNQAIRAIAFQAYLSIQAQKAELQDLLSQNHEQWAQQMTEIFRVIAAGITADDIAETNRGLRELLKTYEREASLYETGVQAAEDLIKMRNGTTRGLI